MSSNINSIKLQLLWKQGKRCAICGKKIHNLDDLTVDHIIPLSKGGKNDIYNCQLAHRLCNSYKNDKLPDEYEKILRNNRRRIVKMRIKRLFVFWK